MPSPNGEVSCSQLFLKQMAQNSAPSLFEHLYDARFGAPRDLAL